MAKTGAEPGPPGPPFVLPLIEKVYVVPLVNPVITEGDDACKMGFRQLEVQLGMSIEVPAVPQIQYSTPGCMSHEIVTLASPATILTLVGADADEPLPPQLARSMVATITMRNAKNLFISMTSKWKPGWILSIAWKMYVVP